MLNLLSKLNPYMLWIKIGVGVLIAGSLIGIGIWFRGVLSDRDALRISEAAAVKTAKDLTESAERDAKLREGITNAIKNIRVVSNNYIQSVEADPPPDAPDGGTVVLVAGGVLVQPQGLPIFANRSTSRTGSAAPPR